MFANNMSNKTGVRSLSFNAGFLVFSRVLEKAILFIYILILARLLGPEMIGLYNYGLAWYLIFLPLACWALGQLLGMYLGRKPSNTEDIVGATLLIRIFATVLAALFCFIIGFLTNDDPLSRIVVSVFVIALVGRSLAMWGRACFVAVELSHYSAGLEVGFRLLEVFCGLIYFFFGGGIIGLCAIHSACFVVEGLIAIVLVRKRLSFRKIFVPSSFLRPYAVEAFPIVLNIFFLLALFQSGFVVLKHVSMDMRTLGLYTVASLLISNTAFISEALGNAALPILSRAHARGTGETIIFLEAMLKICTLCSAVLIIFVIIFDTIIIQILYGEKYLMASGVLVICAIAMLSCYALPIVNSVLYAGFEYVLAAVNIGVALIANIIVTILLVPSMAEKAPAFGLLTGASIALILHLILIHRRIGKISWWRSVIKPNASVILAITVTWNLKQFGVWGLGVGLVILGACFAGWKMITPQEVDYFVKLVPWLHRS